MIELVFDLFFELRSTSGVTAAFLERLEWNMSSLNANNKSKQHVITVGIIGSCKQSYSKDWVCRQIISNKLSNGKSSQNSQSLHDPFEWIRSFQSAQANDRCSQKVLLYFLCFCRQKHPCTQTTNKQTSLCSQCMMTMNQT